MSRTNCCIEQTLSLPSKAKNLALLRHFVGDFVTACGFSEEETFDTVLAVGEACSNALLHGSPRGENNFITVECRCDASDMRISVTDEGLFVKRVNFCDDDYSMKSNGRGIMIMLAVMDQVTINESDNGTTVVLFKRHSLDRSVFEKVGNPVCRPVQA